LLNAASGRQTCFSEISKIVTYQHLLRNFSARNISKSQSDYRKIGFNFIKNHLRDALFSRLCTAVSKFKSSSTRSLAKIADVAKGQYGRKQ